ncbi:hypothetical protein Ocin01_01333 [Orchesella cincta]|uniref:Uncharacterized protein n=1 Tax=Orchesella cincta TaxID=48709 RepID=A0A1D2NK46_ORCCI|nr:hypothetical protein Ocin01_01333 [Orchesella cincta]
MEKGIQELLEKYALKQRREEEQAEAERSEEVEDEDGMSPEEVEDQIKRTKGAIKFILSLKPVLDEKDKKELKRIEEDDARINK